MPPQENNKKQEPLKEYIDVTGRIGLATRWFGDEGDTISQYPQYRHLGKSGQMVAGIWNPERRYGFMAPASKSFTTITENEAGSDFTKEWRATIYDSSVSSFYMAENSNLLWGGPSGGTLTQLRLSVTALAGTNVKITDLELYQVNGVRKLFFSYQETGSGGNIGITTPTAQGAPGANNSTWLQATASGGFYLSSTADHFMVVADNGFMYVGDGNYIHKIDGTTATGGANGTATQQVLVAPVSYTFLDGVDFKGYTWFVLEDSPLVFADTASYSGNVCGVYVWDRQSTIANVSDFIPLKGVKNVKKIYVTQSGKVRVICMSSKRTVQIREYNGAVFDVISESAMVSYPTYRDSVFIAGDFVKWLGQDGKFYGHGPLVPGASEELYALGDASAIPTGSFTAGACLYFDANSSTTVSRTGVYFSILDNVPTVSNRIWYPNTLGATPSTGNVFTLVKYFATPVKVNYCRVYHNTGNTSGTTQQGTFNIYLNQATSATTTYNILRSDIQKGWKYCPINQGAKNAVFSIQFSFAWANVTTADATDWMPRIVEIDYEPLTKLQ